MTSMASANQAGTSVPNEVYDLVSVLYHALEGGTTYQKYIDDAQKANDQDLVRFFQQVSQDDNQRAQTAQRLLARKIGQA